MCVCVCVGGWSNPNSRSIGAGPEMIRDSVGGWLEGLVGRSLGGRLIDGFAWLSSSVFEQRTGSSIDHRLIEGSIVIDRSIRLCWTASRKDYSSK
jgi:hypothetical protein